jgi:7-cyano-7-deazaguanine reductase
MKATLPSSPLGKESGSPDQYDSRLLFAIPRFESRIRLGIDGTLPFSGTDLWNAWELTWLTKNGRPEVAHCEIRVPAETPNIIESKSLKLYLNSYSMSRFATADAVQATLKADLARCAGGEVGVTIRQQSSATRAIVSELPGRCIDTSPVACDRFEPDPGLLVAAHEHRISEALHSHLLRSLCPVTRQPDTGSLLVQYKGARIEPGSLLRYLVSFRKHTDFHEACVERIFVDLMRQCGCESLTVYARYQRRGGIDINPFRSTASETVENLRLWRQ